MKKTAFLILILFCVQTAKAQLRMGGGVGLALPAVSNTADERLGLKSINDWGYSLRVAARYPILYQWDLGVEIEASFFNDNEDLIAGTSRLSSTQVYMDYHVFPRVLTPYVGVGFGISKMLTKNGVPAQGQPKNIIDMTGLSFIPRAGIRIGKLNVEIAYQVVTGRTDAFSAFQTTQDKIKVNYSNFQFGALYMIGKRKK